MNNLFAALSDPVRLAADAYEKLGVGIDANALRNAGLVESLRILGRATNGNIENINKLIPRLDAAGVAAMFSGDGFGYLEERIGEISNSAGFATKQFEVLEDTAGARFRRSFNALKNTMIEGGGAFEGITNHAASFMEILAGFPPETITAITAAGALALGLGGLVKVIEGLKRVQSALLIGKGMILAVTGKQTAADTAAAIASGTLTATKAKELLMSGKLSVANATAAIKKGLLTQADIRAAAAAGAYNKQKMIQIGTAAGLTAKNRTLAASNSALSASNVKVATTMKGVAVGKAAVGIASKKVLVPLLLMAAAVTAVAVAMAALSGRARQTGDEIAKATERAQQGQQRLQAQSSNIPRYATGTMYHRGGRAWVGDGGGPEIVDLPVGSKVYSANHSKLLARQEQENSTGGNICHFAAGAIVIDAKNVKEFNAVVKMISEIVPTSKAIYGITG
jgi:hypothetical protein